MKVIYHKKDDALYIEIEDSKIIESEEVAPGIILDYNEQNKMVGIEILNLSRHIPKDDA